MVYRWYIDVILIKSYVSQVANFLSPVLKRYQMISVAITSCGRLYATTKLKESMLCSNKLLFLLSTQAAGGGVEL